VKSCGLKINPKRFFLEIFPEVVFWFWEIFTAFRWFKIEERRTTSQLILFSKPEIVAGILKANSFCHVSNEFEVIGYKPFLHPFSKKVA
jgi:hypothetical protein